MTSTEAVEYVASERVSTLDVDIEVAGEHAEVAAWRSGDSADQGKTFVKGSEWLTTVPSIPW